MKDKDKKNKKEVSSFRLPIEVKDYLTKQAKSQGTTIADILIRILEAQMVSSTPVSDLPKYISSGNIKAQKITTNIPIQLKDINGIICKNLKITEEQLINNLISNNVTLDDLLTNLTPLQRILHKLGNIVDSNYSEYTNLTTPCILIADEEEDGDYLGKEQILVGDDTCIREMNNQFYIFDFHNENKRIELFDEYEIIDFYTGQYDAYGMPICEDNTMQYMKGYLDTASSLLESIEYYTKNGEHERDTRKRLNEIKIKDAKKHKEQLDINDKNFIVSNVVKKAPKKMDIKEVNKIFGELPQNIKEDKKYTIEEAVEKNIEESKKNKKNMDIETIAEIFGEFDLNKIPQVAIHTEMTNEEYTRIFQEITISMLQKCIENDEEIDVNKIMSLAVVEFNKNYGEQTGYNFLGKQNIC
jgi:predicted DNA-binding protein